MLFMNKNLLSNQGVSPKHTYIWTKLNGLIYSSHTHTHTHTHRERERERKRETHSLVTERERHTYIHAHMHICIHAYKHACNVRGNGGLMGVWGGARSMEITQIQYSCRTVSKNTKIFKRVKTFNYSSPHTKNWPWDFPFIDKHPTTEYLYFETVSLHCPNRFWTHIVGSVRIPGGS